MSSGRVSAILESGTARGERGGRLGRGAGGGGQYALVDRGGAAGGLDAGLDGLGDCAVCGVRCAMRDQTRRRGTGEREREGGHARLAMWPYMV